MMRRHSIQLLAVALSLLGGSATTDHVAAASAPSCQRVQGSGWPAGYAHHQERRFVPAWSVRRPA